MHALFEHIGIGEESAKVRLEVFSLLQSGLEHDATDTDGFGKSNRITCHTRRLVVEEVAGVPFGESET